MAKLIEDVRARPGFYGGFAVAIGAAALMLLDVVGVGWGSAIGIVGVGLIAGATHRTG